MINIGIVGSGKMAKIHASIYKLIKNANVKAVIDLDKTKAEYIL
jgi:predicted dehydrogenase